MGNKQQLVAALATIVVSCGLAASVWGQRPAPTRPPGLQLGRQPPICDRVFDVKNTDPDEQGHLKVGHWLRLIGPITPQGHMLVIPWDGPNTPAHGWRKGVYIAHREPGNPQNPPWTFILEVPVLSPPDHPDIDIHRYKMTIPAPLENGCPAAVQFDTLPEPGEIVDDHPGHADA